jgi:hypothetical protein
MCYGKKDCGCGCSDLQAIRKGKTPIKTPVKSIYRPVVYGFDYAGWQSGNSLQATDVSTQQVVSDAQQAAAAITDILSNCAAKCDLKYIGRRNRDARRQCKADCQTQSQPLPMPKPQGGISGKTLLLLGGAAIVGLLLIKK